MIRVISFWGNDSTVKVDGEVIPNGALETVLNAIEAKGCHIITVLREVFAPAGGIAGVRYKVVTRKADEAAPTTKPKQRSERTPDDDIADAIAEGDDSWK